MSNPFERCISFNEEQKKVLDMVKENPDKYLFFVDNDYVSVRELNPQDYDRNVELSYEEYEKYFYYKFDMMPDTFSAMFINYVGMHAEPA